MGVRPTPMLRRKPMQLKQQQAKGFKTQTKHTMLVYTSRLGPSLYFNKNLFEGDDPAEVMIQIAWRAKPANDTTVVPQAKETANEQNNSNT
jgi:hypothetical protein